MYHRLCNELSIEKPEHWSDSYLSSIIDINLSKAGVRSRDDINRASRSCSEIDIEYYTPSAHHSDGEIPSGSNVAAPGVEIEYDRRHTNGADQQRVLGFVCDNEASGTGHDSLPMDF